MSLTVFLAVLAAAAAHAIWNAMVKVRLDRFASLTLMSIGMGVFALPVLPFVDVPQGVTWLWIVASVVFHTGYRWFLVKAYETGDLAQSYPLARGTAPLLTTLGGVFLLAEFPAPLTIGGIALLSLGTLLMSFRGGDPTAAFSRRAVTYALITSLFVASYTLTDGTGARSAATASSYAAWLFAVDAVWCLILGVLVRGKAIAGVMIPEWKTGIITGVLAAGSYWIAMWAFTQAPIAAVAALRETSILFAMLISVVVLREAVTPWRVIAALFIVGGVVALRLG